MRDLQSRNEFCYIPRANTKKVLVGFGDSNTTAALKSRNSAESCGFFVRAPVLVARMGGRKACRLCSSAVVPVRQPVRATSPFGDGVVVDLTTTGATHMAEAQPHLAREILDAWITEREQVSAILQFVLAGLHQRATHDFIHYGEWRAIQVVRAMLDLDDVVDYFREEAAK